MNNTKTGIVYSTIPYFLFERRISSVNKRQSKKFKGKLKCKTYKGFELMQIVKAAEDMYGENSFFFPYIVTDGKNIKHAYIVQMRSMGTEEIMKDREERRKIFDEQEAEKTF